MYAQLRSSHHQGPYRSIRWIASQLTVLYSRALVSITNVNIYIYIYIGIKKTFLVLTVTLVKSVGPITSEARVELKPGLGLDLKTENPATPSA